MRLDDRKLWEVFVGGIAMGGMFAIVLFVVLFLFTGFWTPDTTISERALASARLASPIIGMTVILNLFFWSIANLMNKKNIKKAYFTLAVVFLLIGMELYSIASHIAVNHADTEIQESSNGN